MRIAAGAGDQRVAAGGRGGVGDGRREVLWTGRLGRVDQGVEPRGRGLHREAAKQARACDRGGRGAAGAQGGHVNECETGGRWAVVAAAGRPRAPNAASALFSAMVAPASGGASDNASEVRAYGDTVLASAREPGLGRSGAQALRRSGGDRLGSGLGQGVEGEGDVDLRCAR